MEPELALVILEDEKLGVFRIHHHRIDLPSWPGGVFETTFPTRTQAVIQASITASHLSSLGWFVRVIGHEANPLSP